MFYQLKHPLPSFLSIEKEDKLKRRKVKRRIMYPTKENQTKERLATHQREWST